MRCYQIIVTIVTLCIPLPSNQHFIFPLNMCVLADICNHTWIPECGREKNDGNLRLFIDECDMFEFNCDREKNYEVQNYSDCFSQATLCPTFPPCPSHPPCPDHRFHRMGQRFFYITQNGRRMLEPPKTTIKVSLPYHMLHGKRRYTPIPRIRRERMKKEARRKTMTKTNSVSRTMTKTKPISKMLPKTKLISKMLPKTKPISKMLAKTKPISKIESTKVTKVLYKTIILKRESIVKNGKLFMKIIKAYVTKSKIVTQSMTSICTKDSDFLEK